MIRKILGLALVATLSLALASPVSAASRGAPGGGFHGGHGGFHHRGGFRGSCCWGGAFVGGVFLGSALAYPYYPYYPYPYYAYPYYAYPYPVYQGPAYAPTPVYQEQTQVTIAPSVQREVCYVGGCYHLQGDGVTVAYQWIWMPTPPVPPAGPPSQ